MKVLLSVVGNVACKYGAVDSYPENYISKYVGKHEVVTFSFSEGADITLKPDESFDKVLEQLPRNWWPDVCVLWNIDWYLLPKEIEKAPFPTVVVQFDWDFDIHVSNNIKDCTDMIIIQSRSERRLLERMGFKCVSDFYFQGVIEDFFATKVKPIDSRPYDIIYTTPFLYDPKCPDRIKWVYKLACLPSEYKILIKKAVDFKDYFQLLSKSKATFAYNRYGAMSIRFVEAATQGTVVLDGSPETQEYFEPFSEYVSVSYENFENMASLMLKNRGRLQNMSLRVYEKAYNQFRAPYRFEKLLDMIEDKLNSLHKLSSRRPFIKFSEAEKHTRRGEVYYYMAHRYVVPDFFKGFTMSKMLFLSFDEFSKAIQLEERPRQVVDLAICSSSLARSIYKPGYEAESYYYTKLSLDLLNRVIEKYPNYFLGYFFLGLKYYEQVESYDDAEIHFKKGLELLESGVGEIDLFALQDRGSCFFDHSVRFKLTQAVIEYLSGQKQEALEKTREFFIGILSYLLALIYEKKGKIEECVRLCGEAAKIVIDNSDIQRYYARLLTISGKISEAKRYYRNAIDVQPLDMELRLEYLIYLYLCGDMKTIRNEVKKLLLICERIEYLFDWIPIIQIFLGKVSRAKTKFCAFNELKHEILKTYFNYLITWLRINSNNIEVVTRACQLE